MELFLAILLAFIVGYWLSQGNWVEQRTEDARGWWQSRFRPDQAVKSFREWASGPGQELLNADFRNWLAGLSDKEVQGFLRALDEYASRLGYDLDDLVDGGLDDQPERQAVFVEAIQAYGHAYRAAQAVPEEETPDTYDPSGK